MNLRNAIVAGALASLVSACSPYPTTEADFGNSVRHLIQSQGIPTAVDTTPVETGDGERLNGVVEAYRAGAEGGEQMQAPVVVGIGSAPQ